MMDVKTLSPFVFWGQTKKDIILRVDLRNVKNPDVDIQERTLNFQAIGIGARGLNNYSFCLEFYTSINPRASSFQVSEMQVVVTLSKMVAETWPRLLATPSARPEWLKVNFDQMEPEEISDGESDQDQLVLNPQKPYQDLLRNNNWKRPKKPKKSEDYRKAYLFLYNLFQFVGFLYILIVMGIRYLKSGPDSMTDTFRVLGGPFKFCQALQILEILHPLLKFTGGSAFMPFVQVAGRLFVTFVMLDAEPRMHTKPVVFYIFLIYSLAEIVRYPYYMLKVYNYAVDFLTWLRYSVWIILYPLGFLCEGVIILRNIPYFEETGRFSLSLPNAVNFSFYFPTILRIYLLLGYFPALYFVMTYMRRQRKQVLGPRHKQD